MLNLLCGSITNSCTRGLMGKNTATRILDPKMKLQSGAFGRKGTEKSNDRKITVSNNFFMDGYKNRGFY